jgi:hypothetical protein
MHRDTAAKPDPHAKPLSNGDASDEGVDPDDPQSDTRCSESKTNAPVPARWVVGRHATTTMRSTHLV